MKAILTRRIMRLNLDYALAIIDGRNIEPFKRRAKSLSAAYLAITRMEDA